MAGVQIAGDRSVSAAAAAAGLPIEPGASSLGEKHSVTF